jgi:hypothetical protein
MTDQQFRDWLQSEVLASRMTQQQQDDLLEQKQFFDAHRTEIEQRFQQQVVGYVSGKREVSPTAQALLSLVERNYPGRMVYFEPVGFDLF